MKTSPKFLVILVLFYLISGCAENNISPVHSSTNKYTYPLTIEVPFKADFKVWDQSNSKDNWCEGNILSTTLKGNGVISQVGKISVSITLCKDLSTGKYWNKDCVMKTVNGDELYACIPFGQIVPNEEANSNCYCKRFNDEMTFTGGTGRFQKASGNAMTNAYIHYPDDDYLFEGDSVWHTDFFSTGTLILSTEYENN